MFVEAGCPSVNLPRCFAHLEDATGGSVRFAVLIKEGLDHFSRLELFVFHQLQQVIDRSRRDLSFGQNFQGFIGGLVGQEVDYELIDLRADFVGYTFVIRHVAGIVGQFQFAD